MYSSDDRVANHKSWRRQGLEMLFCLLGLIWVGNPNFHSFSHLVDLSHQHPNGSVYSHSQNSSETPAANLTEAPTAMVDAGDSLAKLDSSLASHEPDSVASDATEANGKSSPKTPGREPDDSDAPFFYLHLLETEASCSASFEISLDLSLPLLDKPNFECVGLFSSAELGTIGARGPPVLMALRNFQLI